MREAIHVHMDNLVYDLRDQCGFVSIAFTTSIKKHVNILGTVKHSILIEFYNTSQLVTKVKEFETEPFEKQTSKLAQTAIIKQLRDLGLVYFN